MQKYYDKYEFLRDRLSMHFGSLTNLYSNSPTPPSVDEIFAKAVEITELVWNAGHELAEFTELEDVLKEKTFEEYNLKERKIGRYYASELYNYFTDKLPPDKFLEPPLPTERELRIMFWGTIIHEGIQKLFGYQELKYEIPINEEVVLVYKPDLILSDGTLVEIKTKENLLLYQKVWEPHFLQCQAYLQALGKNEMKLYIISWGLSRKLFVIKKDQKEWEKIVKNLLFYHQKVVNAYRKK